MTAPAFSLCVYCGSRTGRVDAFKTLAAEVGQWIGDNGRFESHYPDWKLEYDVPAILQEIYDVNRSRWAT